MDFRLKTGVQLRGLTPQALLGAVIVKEAWSDLFPDYPCVLTSVGDGKHGRASLHYQGNAFDLRIADPGGKWALSMGAQMQIVGELKRRLGGEFDVVLESTHIHIEWQPKTD